MAECQEYSLPVLLQRHSRKKVLRRIGRWEAVGPLARGIGMRIRVRDKLLHHRVPCNLYRSGMVRIWRAIGSRATDQNVRAVPRPCFTTKRAGRIRW